MALHEEDLTQEHLFSRFAQLENFVVESHDHYLELQEQLKELTQVMATTMKEKREAMATPTSPPVQKPTRDEPKDIKIAIPDTFTGNRSNTTIRLHTSGGRQIYKNGTLHSMLQNNHRTAARTPNYQ